MFNEYVRLVRDTIAQFQDEWKLSAPAARPQKPVEMPVKPLPAPVKKVVALPPEVKLPPAESPSQMRQLLQKSMPALRLRETPLDDAEATRRMQAWQEYVGEVDVILLATSRDTSTMELIKNLAKNIEQKKVGRVKALSADRLEREKRWDLFLSKNRPKLLIASAELVQMQGAMNFYKQNTATAQATLGGIPLLVLAAPESYGKQEKIALWNTLCHLLKV